LGERGAYEVFEDTLQQIFEEHLASTNSNRHRGIFIFLPHEGMRLASGVDRPLMAVEWGT